MISKEEIQQIVMAIGDADMASVQGYHDAGDRLRRIKRAKIQTAHEAYESAIEAAEAEYAADMTQAYQEYMLRRNEDIIRMSWKGVVGKPKGGGK